MAIYLGAATHVPRCNSWTLDPEKQFFDLLSTAHAPGRSEMLGLWRFFTD
jgi:hypothetical protein